MLTRKTTSDTTEYSSRSNGDSRSSPATGGQVTQEQIARRAYEIYKSGAGGTPESNWYRAERELRARA